MKMTNRLVYFINFNTSLGNPILNMLYCKSIKIRKWCFMSAISFIAVMMIGVIGANIIKEFSTNFRNFYLDWCGSYFEFPTRISKF